MSEDGAPPRLARSWVAHLRDGGTSTWSAWAALHESRTTETDGGSAPPGRSAPGCAQLEALRLINEHGAVGADLAEHLLTRAAPGHGHADLPLPWPATEPCAGPDEVNRLLAGVLADLSARLPDPEPRPRRRPTRRTAPFLLDGLPVAAAELRQALAASGAVERRPGEGRRGLRSMLRRRPSMRVVVLAGPVPEALRQVWSTRVQMGAERPFRAFLGHWARKQRLPGTADASTVVRHWNERLPGAQVHVVVGDGTVDDLVADRVSRIIGVRPARDAADAGPGRPARLSAVHTDVLRRVNPVLAFGGGPDEVGRRRRALVEVMGDVPTREVTLRVPQGRRIWTDQAGQAVIEALGAAGCEVHGDLDDLLRPDADAGTLGRDEVTDAMVRLVRVVHDRTQGGVDG